MDHIDWGTGTAGQNDALRVIVAGNDDAQCALAAKALEITGARLVAQVSLDALGERLIEQVAIDLVMLELGNAPARDVDRAIDLLLTSAHSAEPHAVPVIAAIDIAQIDSVAARLHGPNVQLLCTPSLAERTAAIAIVREGRGGAALSDLTRESEHERLKRLDEDVARIANALARLTGRDPTAPRDAEIRPAGVTLHERSMGYGAPPLAMPATTDVALAGRVRAAIKARRMRDHFFEPALFADPAWDMLLDLFAARLEHVQVSVSSLCIAAAVPPTTALRWIATMSEAGLLERRADPLDRRRAFMVISDEAASGMRAYVEAAERAGLTMA